MTIWKSYLLDLPWFITLYVTCWCLLNLTIHCVQIIAVFIISMSFVLYVCLNLTSFEWRLLAKTFHEKVFFFFMKTTYFGQTLTLKSLVLIIYLLIGLKWQHKIFNYKHDSAIHAWVYHNFCGGTRMLYFMTFEVYFSMTEWYISESVWYKMVSMKLEINLEVV